MSGWASRMRAVAASGSLLLGLSAARAGAVTLDFEGLPVGSNVAAASLPAVQVSSALVVDEAFVEAVLGFPATGTWNTSPGGSQGLLNTLGAQITFTFPTPVTSFAVEVLGLPSGSGSPQRVLLEAFDGADREASVVSNVSRFGDSGLHEDTLAVAGGLFTSIRLTPIVEVPCPQLLCFEASSFTTSFFVDDVRFEPVPEPGTALLVGFGFVSMGVRRAKRAASSG